MKDTIQAAIIELRQVLSQKIIPRISSNEHLRMILARLPLHLPPDVSMKRQPAPTLQVHGKCKSDLFLAQYKKEAMHAIRFPYFCYVVEGEIDMRLGIPPRSGKSRNAVNNYHVLTLPKQTLLLIPPGVFYPDGSRAHWERAPIPPVDAQMLWMRVLPNGVACHISTTQKYLFTSTRYNNPPHYEFFVPDLQSTMLTEILMDDLQSSDPNAGLAAHNMMSLILLRVLRGLGKSAQMEGKHLALVNTNTVGAISKSAQMDGRYIQDSVEKKYILKNPLVISPALTNSNIVEHACNFILHHRAKPFSIEDVADALHISPSHLARLFRAEMKTTIKQYALKGRLEQACYMLINTEASIQEIARWLGYMQTPQFNYVFKKIHHVTPREFRLLHRNDKIR